jgi:hypothetical protein
MEKTHDKDPLCRAPERKRTAKIFTHGKLRFSRCDPFVDALQLSHLLTTGTCFGRGGTVNPFHDVRLTHFHEVVFLLLCTYMTRAAASTTHILHANYCQDKEESGYFGWQHF